MESLASVIEAPYGALLVEGKHKVGTVDVYIVRGNEVIAVPLHGAVTQRHLTYLCVIVISVAYLTLALGYYGFGGREERVIYAEVLGGILCLYTQGEVGYLSTGPSHGWREPVRYLIDGAHGL